MPIATQRGPQQKPTLLTPDLGLQPPDLWEVNECPVFEPQFRAFVTAALED